MAEVRQDTLTGCRRAALFLLSFAAGIPLVLSLLSLTEGKYLAVILGIFLIPAMTLLLFWRRGYRCCVCKCRCNSLAVVADKWRYHCPQCDIEWQVDKPDCGGAA
jgi:hypothetical protein